MDQLRILQVSPSDTGGGAQRCALSLFEKYRSLGFASWLAVGRKTTTDPGIFEIPNARERSSWSKALRRVCWNVPGDGIGARLIRKFAWWFAEPLRFLEIQAGLEDFHHPGTRYLLSLPPRAPTLLHCHNLHGDYFDLRLLPSLCRQLPVVLNLHDAWLFSGHCAHSLGCNRWQTGCGQCPDLTIYPSVRRDLTHYNWHRKKAIFRNSRFYITTPSRWLMQKQEMSILHGVDCRVIPNGVDLEIFRLGNQASARRTLGLPEQARIVLLIAHSPFKDLATMEAALARVRPVDNKSLLYLCLGREDEEKQVGAGTMRYVKLQRDLERLIKYYQAADIYLHAAFADTFPNTIAEAMACGLPVVATDTGGIPELIEDGSNGFLVAPQDPVQMAQKIEYLINNPEKCEQMRAAAARHARTNFDVNVQVNRLLEWYREIVADWSQWVGRHTAPRTEVR